MKRSRSNTIAAATAPATAIRRTGSCVGCIGSGVLDVGVCNDGVAEGTVREKVKILTPKTIMCNHVTNHLLQSLKS